VDTPAAPRNIAVVTSVITVRFIEKVLRFSRLGIARRRPSIRSSVNHTRMACSSESTRLPRPAGVSHPCGSAAKAVRKLNLETGESVSEYIPPPAGLD
jgi:hypothetical protein